MIIVIDGPAGSGKSSTAQAVAKKMSIEYLDSGALYRAATWMFIQADQDQKVLFDMLSRASISFYFDSEEFHVLVDEKDITDQLRSEAINNLVSKVASFPRVRSIINARMQKAIRNGRYIAEGRDLGTAVFPDAELKFFMKADAEERARRRYKELEADGVDVSFSQVRQNIRSRDQKDTGRVKDPLKKAPDAIELDNTEMSFEEQVQYVCSIISDKTELTFKS